MNAADLKHFAILQELSEDEREMLCEILEERPLSANETLFAQGDEAESLVLVESGALVLSRDGETGVAKAGTTLGELALFRFGTREVTAASEGSANVFLLRREEFRRFIEDAPHAAFRLAEAVLSAVAERGRDALAEDAAG